jgi:hypothetical protein
MKFSIKINLKRLISNVKKLGEFFFLWAKLTTKGEKNDCQMNGIGKWILLIKMDR